MAVLCSSRAHWPLWGAAEEPPWRGDAQSLAGSIPVPAAWVLLSSAGSRRSLGLLWCSSVLGYFLLLSHILTSCRVCQRNQDLTGLGNGALSCAALSKPLIFFPPLKPELAVQVGRLGMAHGREQPLVLPPCLPSAAAPQPTLSPDPVMSAMIKSSSADLS